MDESIPMALRHEICPAVLILKASQRRPNIR